MKIKVRDMMAAYQAATSMAGEKMPSRAAYWLARLIAKLEREYVIAEGKRRELVNKHGTERKNSDGKVVGVAVPPEKMEAFKAEFDSIADEMIDADIMQLNISVFDGANVKPADLLALEPMLIDAPADG